MKHRNITIFLPAIFLIFSVSAYFIIGSLNPDEHYQILEFANFKRGLVESKNLPWEFEERLRSTIQPTVALIVLLIFDFITIKDPFIQAFLLRLMSTGFFIFCSSRLYDALVLEFKKPTFKYFYFALTFFLYFFPFIGVRFSSENFSSCFYMLAFTSLYQYLKRQENSVHLSNNNAFAIGSLLGLSFLFRYQAAIMIAGLALWLLTFHFRMFKSWVVMFGGFMGIIIVGIVIDRWFYGQWAFTAWNYFHVNLMEGKAASFGIEPWWGYFNMINFKRMALLNGGLLVLIALFAVIKFKHPVTWIFFPFVLIHFLIPHKEMRFLYPVFVYVPFMVGVSLQFLYDKLDKPFLFYLSLTPFIAINGFAFIASSFDIPDNSIEFFKYTRTLPNKPIVVYYNGNDVRFYYTLSNGEKTLTPRFYKDHHTVIAREKPQDTVPTYMESSDTLAFTILYDWEQPELQKNLKVVYEPESNFMESVNYHNWMRRDASRWKIYGINKITTPHSK